MAKKKSLARLMAVQVFYQSGFDANSNLENIKENLVQNYLLSEDEELSSYENKSDQEFLNKLIYGLEPKVSEIDLEIEKFLRDGFRFDDLDQVLLQILRLAVFEIKFLPEIATKVIINEYVDIAASFFDESRVTFVNAIIDSIAKSNR